MSAVELLQPTDTPDAGRRRFLRGLVAAGSLVALGELATIQPASADETIQGDQVDVQPAQSTTEPTDLNHDVSTLGHISSVKQRPSKSEERAEAPTNNEKHAPIWDFPTWYEQLGDPDQSIFRSLGQGAIVDVASIAIGVPLIKLGVPIGNGHFNTLRENPRLLINTPPAGELLFRTSVLAPLEEEFKFRIAPSAAINMFNKLRHNAAPTTSSQLAGALASSAYFGYVHNRGAEHKAIPLPQTAAGLLYWRLIRNNGMLHPIAHHALSNAIFVGQAMPKYEKRRQAILADWEAHGGEVAAVMTSPGNWDLRKVAPGGWNPQFDKDGNIVNHNQHKLGFPPQEEDTGRRK